MIKWRRTRWVRPVEHIAKKRNTYKVLIRKPEENKPLEYRREEGRIILQCTLNRATGCGFN
jgi:hypothetical protein